MEVTESKTRQALLDNTVNHFNTDNLCTNDAGLCVYRNHDNSLGCAIGREISDELALSFDRRNSYPSVRGVFTELPKRLKDMGLEFLCSIQRLHDDEKNWTRDWFTRTR